MLVAFIDGPADVAEVGAADGGDGGPGIGWQEADEGLVVVGGVEGGGGARAIPAVGEFDVDGGEDAAVEGAEVGGKDDGGSGVDVDLGVVAVLEDVVGLKGDLAEE